MRPARRMSVIAALLALTGCGSSTKGALSTSDSPDDSGAPPGADGAAPAADDDATVFMVGDATTPVVSGDGGPVVLPANFVKTELGGYALGPAIAGDGADAGVPGEHVVRRTAAWSRASSATSKNKGDDNGTGHPDFDAYTGVSPTTGLVLTPLGTGRHVCLRGRLRDGLGLQPVVHHGPRAFDESANFDQWYRYTPNVNKPFLLYLQLGPQSGGLHVPE